MIPFLYQALSCIGVFLVGFLIHIIWLNRRPKINLPGPKGWPLIGLGLDLPRRPRQMLNDYRQKYGDMFQMRLGWYDWIFFNDPRDVKEVFDRKAAVTSHKVNLPMAHDYVMGDRGILSMTYSPKWRKMRGFMHQILTPKASAAFIPSQEFEIKQLLNDFAGEEGKNSTDFYMFIRRMTFSIMMTSTYGTRIPEWDCDAVRGVYGNMRILSIILRPGTFWVDVFPPLKIFPLWMMPSYWMARKAKNFMQNSTMKHWYQLKEKYEMGQAPECFAKHLMEANYEEVGLDEVTMSWLAHAVPEAGAETTASALNSLLMHLATHPEAQEAANQEVTRVLGNNRLANIDDEESMPYIRAVIKEILRMCPVATTGLRRMAGEDFEYKGVKVPKQTILLANINALHWDETRFSEPYKFKPERYLNHPFRSAVYANSADVEGRDHFTFGAGRRICPGIHLAENGLFLAVANLIWAFEFKRPLDDMGNEKEMDIGDEAFLDGAIRIPKPYEVRIVPRNPERLKIVRDAWAQAERDGYTLRGMEVDAKGGIKV